ncbi:putative toxin [Ralstonia solanacearum]|uniref:putative toxin n=1 Tax=Ralstonia solanacearum TaxID=305 RepID=UPI0018D0DD50|nr:putative toxin [Ralstonia solanacearum]MCM2263531.1 putative toxin [Ralstonia solanacearum]MDD7803949.1 putative toxin [Ralstonia solanacearum]
MPVLRTDTTTGVSWSNPVGNGSQITQNWTNGRAFQNALNAATGLPENTTPVTVTLPNGARVTTVPDNLGRPAGIVEAKNELNLSMNDQFRAQIQFAAQTGTPYTLVVSPANRVISEQLWKAIAEVGGTVYRFDPATQNMTRIVTRPH